MPKKTLSGQATDPASIEALARRFAGPALASKADREWDEASVKAFVAATMTALRLKSQAKLDEAFEAFGGPPPQSDPSSRPAVDWNAEQLLSEAARDHGAFGFESILAAQQGERSSRIKDFDLAEWLRGGLINSAWTEREPHGRRSELKSSMARPLRACFARDNPIALAKILKDPERFAALAGFEPKPNPALPGVDGLLGDGGRRWKGSESEALMKAARSSDSGFETGLMWEAISGGAFRCAALLAAIPEFNAALARPRCFAAVLEDAGWAYRRGQDVFAESEKGVEFSLFELAVCMRENDDAIYGERDQLRASWGAMVESMAENASPEAKAWEQEGTGMGWTEILFARLAPHRWGDAQSRGNDIAERDIAEFMRLAARFEERGFEPQWAAMAKASAQCPMLKDWLGMREATAGGPGLGAAKKRALSL